MRAAGALPHLGRTGDELVLGMRSLSVGHYTIFYGIDPASISSVIRVLSGYRDVDALH